MKLLIFGGGLMGPAAAHNALSDAAVTRVAVADLDPAALRACRQRLGAVGDDSRFETVQLDLHQRAAAVGLMAQFDVVVTALPWSSSLLAIDAALAAGVPLVDLARPDEKTFPELRRAVEAVGGLVVLGCGLEPGLTEIMARYLAEQLSRVDEVHIKCGGIPERPRPPLGYKIVFGGRQLPLQESDAYMVEHGQLTPVPRYSGVERVEFAGVGICEAWHEGFMPWLLALPCFQRLRLGTQKTVRWPGYAAKVTVLKELGLLSEKPIEVDGVRIAPKHFLDVLLYPRLRLEPGERDVTVFRVEAEGERNGCPCRLRCDMVDYYDERTGFTSMARTTAFTASIVARMIAGGEVEERGLQTPERIITGDRLQRLLNELAAVGITLSGVPATCRPPEG